jgi:hypothetical protein
LRKVADGVKKFIFKKSKTNDGGNETQETASRLNLINAQSPCDNSPGNTDDKKRKPLSSDRGLSMKGNIYSGQKCRYCGIRSFTYDERRNGLFCSGGFRKRSKNTDGVVIEKYFEPHEEVQAAGLFKVQFGKGVDSRFTTLEAAQRRLTSFRYKQDTGSFDPRDFQSGKPMNFENQYPKFIDEKVDSGKIGESQARSLRRYMRKAEVFWMGKNVKDIAYTNIAEVLKAHQARSSKERANMLSAYHDFFVWLMRCKIIEELPNMPEIKVTLGTRKIVTKQQQFDILDEIKRISYHINPKIWLGIKWMASYPSLRPFDFNNMKEGYINVGLQQFRIPDASKDSGFRIVPMIEEDVQILEGMVRGLPDMHFFRHVKGIQSVKEGRSFGEKYFYKWFKKAAKNLNFDPDLDLYGATKHSTITHLRTMYTKEEIKEATYHTTNKALDRYLQADPDVKDVYEYASRRPSGDEKRSWGETGKILKLP